MSIAPSPIAPPVAAPAVRNPALLAGGYFSLAFALFQASAIWWPARVIRYFGGPARLSQQQPLTYAALCLVVAVFVGGFGFYALSGAGRVRRLPLLRTGLITATVIYLLRGMVAFLQAPVALSHPEVLRFLIFSLISLAVGIVHACGVVRFYRQRRSGV